MTRIIALDIDGVLNCHETYRLGYRPPIDPVLMRRLEILVLRADARVVVSSTWRLMHHPDDLRDMFIAAGGRSVADRIVGQTPWLRKPNGATRPRGEEIAAWLESRPDRSGASLVILDDADDMGDLLPNLIQTDPRVGLTEADCERAIDLFGRVEFALSHPVLERPARTIVTANAYLSAWWCAVCGLHRSRSDLVLVACPAHDLGTGDRAIVCKEHVP